MADEGEASDRKHVCEECGKAFTKVRLLFNSLEQLAKLGTAWRKEKP